MMPEELSTLKGILREGRGQLFSRANVVATGIGYKVKDGKKTPTLSVVCSVIKKIQISALSSQDLIPKMVGGIPTDVVETGRIRALQSHTARIRPAPGGVSIGHRDITAGTLGCLGKRKRPQHTPSTHPLRSPTTTPHPKDH